MTATLCAVAWGMLDAGQIDADLRQRCRKEARALGWELRTVVNGSVIWRWRAWKPGMPELLTGDGRYLCMLILRDSGVLLGGNKVST